MITVPLAAVAIAGYSLAGAIVVVLLGYLAWTRIQAAKDRRYCRKHYGCGCRRTVRTDTPVEVFA